MRTDTRLRAATVGPSNTNWGAGMDNYPEPQGQTALQALHGDNGGWLRYNGRGYRWDSGAAGPDMLGVTYGVNAYDIANPPLPIGTYCYIGWVAHLIRFSSDVSYGDLNITTAAKGKRINTASGWSALGNSGYPINSWTWCTVDLTDYPPLVVDAQGYLDGWQGWAFNVECTATQNLNVAKWGITNWRARIHTAFQPPSAYISAPTGTIATNRPTIVWAFSSPDALPCSYFQVRVFSQAQVAASGFNPATSPSAYDSGQRPYAAGAESFTLPFSLDSGQWRAYTRVWQNYYGLWDQPSLNWPNVAFTINTTAPPRDPPPIPANVVANLSDTQRARITNAHVPQFQARLYWWDGSASWPLDLLGGNVTLDARAKLRGRANFTATNYELVPPAPAPLDFSKPLHPYGSYVHLARGLTGALVSLGVYRVESVKIEQKGQGAPIVEVDCVDFEAHLQDARLLQGQSRQSWATGTAVPNLVTDVAKALISEGGLAFRMPSASSEHVAANYVNERGDDRVDALRSLAASLGWNTYLTHDGAVYFGPPPAINALSPMATLVEGDNAIVLSKSFELSRKDVYDVAAVVNDDANVSGYAYDANSVSPIKRSGVNPSVPTFGAGGFTPAGKPYFLASPVVTTAGSAGTAAITVLQANAMPADRVAVGCVCVPDIRPGDVVTLRRIGADSDERWWVETVTIPLDVTSQQALVLVGPPSYVQAVSA